MPHSPSNTLFRQNALDSLNAIDDISETLQIISPGAWVWLLASILFLATIIGWGLFGSLSLTIESQGVTLAKSQIDAIEINNTKNLLEHRENVDDLYDLYSKKIKLYKNHYITRVDLRKSKDEYLAAKEILNDFDKNIRIPMIDNQTRENAMDTSSQTLVLTFVKHTQGKKIASGMPVQVLPATSSIFEHGYISGSVSSISAYPISKQLAYSYLQNNSLVDTYFSEGAPFLVKIALKSEIQSGTPIVTKINYRTCSPFQLLTKNS